MLDKTQYEDFLTRAGLVLGLDKTPATRQQWNVLAEGLYRLLQDRTPDQITDKMIEGQWDVVEHLHPSDGSLRY
ncbi:MAG: hypothetical protein CL915_15225 [Deltaproteobacteria bacterium]|jgi:hypothetical protein|nr:hypothetical protein [Deltaproteobacteria bacterium]